MDAFYITNVFSFYFVLNLNITLLKCIKLAFLTACKNS